MRDFCCGVVDRFGDNWGMAGWLTFCAYTLSVIAPAPLGYFAPALLALALAWFVFDTLDQGLPGWVLPVGVVAALICFLISWSPGSRYSLLLNGGIWCLYWFQVRE